MTTTDGAQGTTQHDQGSGSARKAEPAPDIKDQLEKIQEQTAKVDYLKSVQNELQALASKLDGLVKQYGDKYPSLLARWDEQQKYVKQIHDTVTATYPKWRDLIKSGICQGALESIKEQTAKVERLQSSNKGTNEQVREEAKSKLDQASARLTAWQAAAAKIDAKLTANAKLIKDIQNLVPGPDQIHSLWLLWFKLLPEHCGLRPSNRGTFPANEAPSTLCPKYVAKEMTDHESEATPDEIAAQAAWPPPYPPRTTPWLISPDQYQRKLNAVWAAYQDAKEKADQADKAFKSAPDDLAAESKKLDAMIKLEEDNIKANLKELDQTTANKAA
jgi:hypothetical protein